MTSIQLVINVFLFLWLLMLTAWVLRATWGRRPNSQSTMEIERLMQKVEDGQNLVNKMSADLLALCQHTLEELDELRTVVRTLESSSSVEAESPVRGPTIATGAPPLPPSLERFQEVYRRAAQGQSVTHIAKELGMGKGEVELVLALGQQSKA